MFRKVNIPILGMIENMSYYVDADGRKVSIFGEGGGKRLADEFSIPLLGSVPIDVSLREASDTGMQYNGKSQGVYLEIARKLTQ